MTFGGPGKYTLPSNHEPGVEVPKGGAHCGNCRFIETRDDGLHCSSSHFIEWNGDSKIPAPDDDPERYCSDWWTDQDDKEARQVGPQVLRQDRHPVHDRTADSKPVYLSVGDQFSWNTIGGDRYAGSITEFDSNDVFVRCSDGEIRATTLYAWEIPIDKRANDPIQDVRDFDGIKVDIEWPAGSVREYPDSDYKRYMLYDYGYIRGVDGADGEELDCFVGDYKSPNKVFVIGQLAGLWESENTDKNLGDFDEYNVFLGFKDVDEAKDCFLLHYNAEEFGEVMEMDTDEFKAFVDQVLHGHAPAEELEDIAEPVEE